MKSSNRIHYVKGYQDEIYLQLSVIPKELVTPWVYDPIIVYHVSAMALFMFWGSWVS